jgi:hypothetical protein
MSSLASNLHTEIFPIEEQNNRKLGPIRLRKPRTTEDAITTIVDRQLENGNLPA